MLMFKAVLLVRNISFAAITPVLFSAQWLGPRYILPEKRLVLNMSIVRHPKPAQKYKNTMMIANFYYCQD